MPCAGYILQAKPGVVVEIIYNNIVERCSGVGVVYNEQAISGQFQVYDNRLG